MTADSPEPDVVQPIHANAGAVPETERIVPMDVLRGFAVLGILVMNIQSFAMIGWAYVFPRLYGDMSGSNYWVWYLSHVLADQKFMTIFSMLFGAGIVLMTGRQEARTGRSAVVHYRRMAVLLLFGLAHAYLIWYGDILVSYALCGMLAYLFRRFRPATLLVLGILFIAVHSGINCGFSWSMHFWDQDGVQEFQRQMNPPATEIEKELQVYRGGWTGQLPARIESALEMQTLMLLTWSLWRAGGLMLIGMALFKLGVFNATRPAATYLAMALFGLLVGVPIIVHGVRQIEEHGWEPIYTMFTGMEFNYWGSLFVSMAYVGLVMLVCRQPGLSRLTGPFAAVGRMALTNYLLQSIICTTIFYGHGLGLFGSVERIGQIGIVLAVWALQLMVSPIRLRYFLFGPAEWLWRALTYWKLPPWRRGDEGERTRKLSSPRGGERKVHFPRGTT